MPRTYLAAVMPSPGAPIELREFPEPRLEPGGVLLETVMSEVCGTDVHLHNGRLSGVPYPIIPGHVSVGRIARMAGAVTDVDGVPFNEGDTVAFLDVHGTCGACRACLVTHDTTRCPHRRVYGITFPAAEGLLGGWAEAIWLKPGTRLLRFPDGLDPETYCGGGCGLNTALHAVDRAQVRLGDAVVVLGVGPVGQSVVAFAGLAGAVRVVAVGAPADRLAFALRMGATETFDIETHTAAERRDAILGLTAGRGADVVIEASGSPLAVQQAFELVRDGGRVVVAGMYTDHGDIPLNPHTQINRKHVQVLGCWGSDFSHFHRAIAVLARHHRRLPWREIISARYRLDQMNEALEAVATRKILKAAVVPR